MRRRALLLAAVLTMVACGSALAADDLLPSEFESRFEASFTPTALSKKEQTPLSLRMGMAFRSAPGDPRPALKEFEIEEDRHARLNLDGVPACPISLDTKGPLLQGICKAALVGHGTVNVTIDFPETTMPPISAPVRVYNGPAAGGAGTLFLVFRLPVPTPAVYISKVSIEKIDDGPYGLRLVGKLPQLAGGSGFATRLGLKFDKGVFSAVCRNRRLATGFDVGFVDGTKVSGASIGSCTAVPEPHVR